jgi:hypothetical protein
LGVTFYDSLKYQKFNVFISYYVSENPNKEAGEPDGKSLLHAT